MRKLTTDIGGAPSAIAGIEPLTGVQSGKVYGFTLNSIRDWLKSSLGLNDLIITDTVTGKKYHHVLENGKPTYKEII